jgi:hypothetical protein
MLGYVLTSLIGASRFKDAASTAIGKRMFDWTGVSLLSQKVEKQL